MICQSYNVQVIRPSDRTTAVSNDPYPHVEALRSKTPDCQCHADSFASALTSFKIWHELIAATQSTRIENLSVLSLSTAFQRLCISASTSALVTGVVPACLREDFAALAPKWPNVSRVEGWLARLDAIPLTNAKHGERPLRNIEDLLVILTTSRKVVTTIRSHVRAHWREPLNVYLIPWNYNSNSDREFRVFCPPTKNLTNSRMAAISQHSSGLQYCHADFLRHADIILYKSWRIFEEIHTRVPSELLQQGFCFDVMYNNETRAVALIELNEWVVEHERSSHGSR